MQSFGLTHQIAVAFANGLCQSQVSRTENAATGTPGATFTTPQGHRRPQVQFALSAGGGTSAPRGPEPAAGQDGTEISPKTP